MGSNVQISGKSFAAGVLVTLVLSSGTAVAATGGKLILGGWNTANRTTTLSNGAGTALSLNSRAGTAPLKVNRTTKVRNLNADRLDGLDSTQLALTRGRTTLRYTTSQALELVPLNVEGDGLAAVAYCPSGTIATGGGAFNAGGHPVYDSYGEANYWVVMTTDLAATPETFGANVTCYNPRGSLAPQGRTSVGGQAQGKPVR